MLLTANLKDYRKHESVRTGRGQEAELVSFAGGFWGRKAAEADSKAMDRSAIGAAVFEVGAHCTTFCAS